MTAPDDLGAPTPATIAARALELAKNGQTGDAVDVLIAAAGGDRALVEAARDEMATRIHAAVDDYDASGALTLLNRALSEIPRHDPLDWRVLWQQRFRRP
jgi:hypothetical protein